MSEVTETITEVQIALNRLLRVVELQEKMAKHLVSLFAIRKAQRFIA